MAPHLKCEYNYSYESYQIQDYANSGKDNNELLQVSTFFNTRHLIKWHICVLVTTSIYLRQTPKTIHFSFYVIPASLCKRSYAIN